MRAVEDLSASRRARLHAREVRAAGQHQACPSCGMQDVTPRHRADAGMWQERAARADAAGGRDPLTGVTADSARRHAAEIGRRPRGLAETA